MDHSADKDDWEADACDNGRDDASTEETSTPKAKPRAARAPGKDLKRTTHAASDLAPFFDNVEASAAPGGQQRINPAHAFGSHAALAIGLMGFAFAVGSYLFGGGSTGEALKATASQAAASQESVERAEMQRTTQKMAEDMRLLKTNVEALRASFGQNQSAQNQNSKDLRALEKSLDGVKTKLDTAKSETSVAIAELASKVDHIQHEPTAKLQQVVERLDRIERQTAAPLITGAIAASPNAAKGAASNRTQVALAKPTLETTEAPKKPQLITSWVVRDVYDGVALVENARGSIEVALGETIPGAGTVKAIERRGGGWVVITSRGVVDYARYNFDP